MPFTFFAHQVPVLPIARRSRGRLDGVTLVVGSMAPDLAFALHPLGIEIHAHHLPAAVTFGVPATLVVSWLVIRVLAPVVPDHLPTAGPWAGFALTDYRGLAGHRLDWPPAIGGALVGIATHVGLDHLTHEWGFLARIWPWWRTPIGDLPFGAPGITPVGAAQVLGHLIGTAACLVLLHRAGRRGWFAAAAAAVRPFPVTPATRWTVAAAALVGGLLGATATLAPVARSSLILAVAGGAFVGLTVVSLGLRRRGGSGPGLAIRPRSHSGQIVR